MNIINTLNDKRFTLNGIQYFKNYVSVVHGNKVEIFNCYERKDVLIELTHYNQFTVNGTVYASAAQLQEALLPVLYSRINMGDGSAFAQNNIGRTINIGFYMGDASIATIVSMMNNRTTTISSTDTPVVLSLISLPASMGNVQVTNKKYSYLFKPGEGIYGIGGITVTSSMIFQLASLNLTPEDIQSTPGAIIYNLDPVTHGDYINKANETTWDFTDSGETNENGTLKTYYFSYTAEDVLYFVQFKGSPGVYGLGNIPFEDEDFAATTNSNITPEKTKLSEFVNDVPYATVAEVNGLDIIVNQAAAELYLKNSEGTTLVTVNLGFLNNEGTTFFYNPITKNLELKNDAGEVLSTVPVSAFVSNLIQSVNFNAVTPSILEFKDSTGTVVTSVTFTINNISGLQAALDLKAPLASPVLTGTPSTPNMAATTTGNQIANADFVQAVATSRLAQTIIDGVTNSAPSQNAIYDNFRRYINAPDLDLNNITETGNYLTAGTGVLNLPNGWTQTRYILTSVGSTGTTYGYQIIMSMSTGLTAFRKLSGNTTTGWSDWVEYAQRNNTLDVGAGILSGINLNTYVTTGLFPQNTQANADVLNLNYPVAEIGMLEVTRGSSNQVYQKYHALTSNTVHVRRMAGASWSGWRKLTDNIDLDLKADKTTVLPTTYLSPVNSVTITAGSMNDIPKGSYTGTLSTGLTEKPFTEVGAILSLGTNGIGGQIVVGRTSNDVYYRGVAGTFGNWRRLVNDLDLDLKADKASPTFTGTVVMQADGLRFTGGSSADYIRGNGTVASFAGAVQTANLGTITPVNTPIATSDTPKIVAGKTQGQLDAKQETLVSGTNIKTIAGQSILGSGELLTGSAGDYVRANGTIASFGLAVQSATIGTISPTNAPIGTNDTFKTAVDKTQGQIDAFNAKVLTGSVTYDFPNILAHSYAETTLTVTGAAMGDVCLVTQAGSGLSADLLLQAYCSGTNTITIRATNLKPSGALDLASQVYKVLVFKY